MSIKPIKNEALVFLGKGVFLSKPKVSSSPSSVPPPTIILIFAWIRLNRHLEELGVAHSRNDSAVGAKLPHVRKYADSYDEIYPEATKIIVQSEPSFFWSIESKQKAYLTPVVEALELLGCLPPATNPSKLIRDAKLEPLIPYPTPRVLVHTFSNGGSWQLSTLSNILAERATASGYSKAALSPSAVILDSCPGNGGVDKTIKAFTGLVRTPFLKKFVTLLIRLIYLYHALKRKLLGQRGDSIIDAMKTTLNTPKLLPWLGKDTPRMYIYSEADDLIPYHEVEAHAAQAREAGLHVRLVKFDDSPHVAHARMHPQRYWAAVRKLWEDASVQAS